MSTPSFHSLIVDLPSTDEEELRSYFRAVAEATGPPHSNFETVLRLIWRGGVGLGDDDPEHGFIVAQGHRRVAAALEAAGDEAGDVLRLCLGCNARPELEVYGLLAGLIVRLHEAIAAHEESGSDLDLPSWLGRLPRRGRQDRPIQWLLEDLVTRAKRKFVSALLSYRDARRRLGLRRH